MEDVSEDSGSLIQPEQAVELCDPEPEQPSKDDEVGEDKPPDYDALSVEDAPPISYEEVLAAKAQEQTPENSFTVGAPPSYIHLFGDERNGEDCVDSRDHRPRRGGRRPHTRTRQSRRREGQQSTNRARVGVFRRFLRNFPDSDATAKFVLISILFLAALALPLSMIIVGFLNYQVCQATEVPLYLIVAGFVIFLEVILHTVLYIGQKCADDETTYRMLRRCDCLAFFLFVWLLVGSNWIIRTGVSGDECTEGDVAENMNMNVTFENGTTTQVVVEIEGSALQGDCTDCSSGVYFFTGVIILCQYAALLCIIVACCSSMLRKRSS